MLLQRSQPALVFAAFVALQLETHVEEWPLIVCTTCTARFADDDGTKGE